MDSKNKINYFVRINSCLLIFFFAFSLYTTLNSRYQPPYKQLLGGFSWVPLFVPWIGMCYLFLKEVKTIKHHQKSSELANLEDYLTEMRSSMIYSSLSIGVLAIVLVLDYVGNVYIGVF